MKALTSATTILALSLGAANAGDLANYDTGAKSPLLDLPAPAPESPWEFEIGPYMWLANMKGDVAVAGIASSVDISIDDILDNLDFVFSTTAGVRYNEWGLFVDFMYIEMSPSSSTPLPLFSRIDVGMEMTMVDPKISYRVYEDDRGWLDLLAGARYMDMSLDLTLRGGIAPTRSNSGSEGWWDAVGGVRGYYQLTDRLFLTGLADVGAGDSDLTWQIHGALGYWLTDSINLTAGYRYMDYDYKNGAFAYDVETHGATVGLGFIW